MLSRWIASAAIATMVFGGGAGMVYAAGEHGEQGRAGDEPAREAQGQPGAETQREPGAEQQYGAEAQPQPGSEMGAEQRRGTEMGAEERHGEEAAGGQFGATLEPGDIAKEPSKYFGQNVRVEGEVETVYNPHVFTLDEDVLFAGPDVLVIAPSPSGQVADDQIVTVSGKLREFVRADIERDYDWFDEQWLEGVEIDLASRPVLIADSVQVTQRKEEGGILGFGGEEEEERAGDVPEREMESEELEAGDLPESEHREGGEMERPEAGREGGY